jgi:hypothetical protein
VREAWFVRRLLDFLHIPAAGVAQLLSFSELVVLQISSLRMGELRLDTEISSQNFLGEEIIPPGPI